MILLDNPVQDQIVEEGIRWFRYSPYQIFEIDGEAGTGKSVTLWRIIEGLKLHPFEILPMAYTGQAAMVMRSKGFVNAKTIHSSLYHLVRERADKFQDIEDNPFKVVDTSVNKKKYVHRFVPLPPGALPKQVKLIVIDEGYMVPKKMLQDITKHGIKILVAGDAGQLPPINDEPAFLTGYGVHHLTQIMRQEAGNPIIYLAHRARTGEPIHCGIYGNNVIVIEDKDLSTDMIMNVGNVICGTNKTRDLINNKVRQYQNKPANPVFGDRVICKTNNWEKTLGDFALTNGLTGFIVSSVDRTKFHRNYKGLFNMDFQPDILSIPFEDILVDYNYFMSDYTERTKMRNNKFEKRGPKAEYFEFAYALTTHSAQGSEYNSGIYIEEHLMPEQQNQLVYTGITRFKHNLIYVKRTRRYY